MEDQAIVELYLARDPEALAQSQQKYGKLCRQAAGRILASREDCEECVNDVWLAAWNAIPPQRPRRLGAFLRGIARNQALKKYEYLTADKRRAQAVCSLEELEECIPGGTGVEKAVEERRMIQVLSAFLQAQPAEKRGVFLRRYYYFESIEEICAGTGFSPGKVTSMLFQLRRRLKDRLEKEELL